jgi:CheY-like chemotaxis protein
MDLEAMPQSEFEQQSVAFQGGQFVEHIKASSADLSLVLVAGMSRINRIVVSRIVERTGLKAVAESPDDALACLERLRPGTVILDGGSDNCECDLLLERVTGQRRASGSNLPNVILITTSNGTPEALAPGKVVDAIVAKPITPETLQPLVARLVEQARD